MGHPIYEKKYLYSQKIIDSACILLMHKYPEYKVPNEYFNLNSKDSISVRREELYVKTGIYYPFSPSVMRPTYLCQSIDTNIIYYFYFAHLWNGDGIYLETIREKKKNGKTFWFESLNRIEKKEIRSKFEQEIISKIDKILLEIDVKKE